MPKGFASMTRERRKAVGGKGGTASQLKGTGHAFNPITAKAAAAKGVAKRKQRAMREAALKLIECGFSAENLALLNLSADEYIYYGGKESSGRKLKELLGRLERTLNGPETTNSIQSPTE